MQNIFSYLLLSLWSDMETVGFLAALNADYQIKIALIHHNTGDLQKHLAWKQMPILVWK